MFKNTFGNKTTLLESYRSQKSHLKAPFRKNKLYGLSFCARSIFRVCWSSKWVPKTYYLILRDQNNFARVTSEPKKPLKAWFRQNLLKGMNFCAGSVFKVFWSSKWVPKTYYNILGTKQFCQSHIGRKKAG